MNPAHLHLLLNHLPLLGTAFGALLLLFALWRKSAELQRLSLGVFVLAALSAVPTYLTGEPAEGVVEHLPGVAEAFIEQHESAALLALGATMLTGVVSLVGLVFTRYAEKLPAWVVRAPLVLALVSGGLLARTANLGGQIRHTEIRAGAAAQTETETKEKEQKEHEREEHE